jgi:hypothetical protein
MVFIGCLNGVEESEFRHRKVLDVFDDVALVGVCRWEDSGGGAPTNRYVGRWETRGVHNKVCEGVSVGGADAAGVR